jgi:hypothetical protein
MDPSSNQVPSVGSNDHVVRSALGSAPQPEYGDEPASPTCSLGILFVHGIGQQTRAGTLVTCGQALCQWLNRWVGGAAEAGSAVPPGGAMEVVDASLVGQDAAEPAAPAWARLRIQVPGAGTSQERTWLLAESWWASVFIPPSYSALARWGILIVPWTLAYHFGARLRRARTQLVMPKYGLMRRLWRASAELAYVLLALALMPLVVLTIGLLLVIGLIPLPRVRSLVGAIQRRLAWSVGDSFVLVDSPIQRAAIIGQVRRDLAWLAGKCQRIAVIAHSQGAAAAHAAVREDPPPQLRLLVTLGSGVNKLSALQAIQASPARWMPWRASAGILMLGVSLPTVLRTMWTADLPLGLVMLGIVFLAFMVLSVLLLSLSAEQRLSDKPANPAPSPSASQVGSVRSTAKWIEIVLGIAILLALVVLTIWLLHDVGGMAWIFWGGFLLLQRGLAAAWDWQPNPEDVRLPRGVAWLDVFASADPVPNGPLFPAGTSTAPLRSEEVANRGSAVSDHTTYWASSDEFVGLVAGAVARVDGLRVDRLRPTDRVHLRVARQQRRWRVGWLRATRTLVLLLTGSALLLQRNNLPRLGAAAAEVTGSFTERLPLVDFSWSLDDASGPIASLVGGLGIVAVGVVCYAGLLGIWRWWDRTAIGHYFQRLDASWFDLPFLVLVVLLAVGVEVGLLVAGGWGPKLSFAATRAGWLSLAFVEIALAACYVRDVLRRKKDKQDPELDKRFKDESWARFRRDVGAVAAWGLAAELLLTPAYIERAVHGQAAGSMGSMGGTELGRWHLLALAMLLAAWALWSPRLGALAHRVEAASCRGPAVIAHARLLPPGKRRRIVLCLRASELLEEGKKLEARIAALPPNDKVARRLEAKATRLAREGADLAELLRDDPHAPVCQLLRWSSTRSVAAVIALAQRRCFSEATAHDGVTR